MTGTKLDLLYEEIDAWRKLSGALLNAGVVTHKDLEWRRFIDGRAEDDTPGKALLCAIRAWGLAFSNAVKGEKQ